MTSRRIKMILPLCPLMLLLAGGCSSNSADWFDPDWDELALERGTRDRLDDDLIPRTTLEEEAEIPVLPAWDADEEVELSIEQAVMLTLRGNRELSVAQLTPVIVGAFEQIERGVFEPEVFAEGTYSREEAIETARATGEQFGVTGKEATVTGGVRQRLPTGTDIELGVSQSRNTSNRAPEEQEARLGLTVTQSLLRGFGPAVNLVSVRQVELETRASLYELRGFIEALIADTEITYWQYLLAERKIEIFERSLEVARSQRDQITQRIEVGTLPRTEAAAARSEVALREQALIDARSELKATGLRLLRLVNGPLDRAAGPGIVPLSLPPAAEEELGELDQRVRLALDLRPDLNEARLRLEQNRLETIRTRNGLLPRLDLFLALGKTGYADTFTDSFKELDGQTYDLTVGVSLAQSLGDSIEEGEHRLSIASRRQSRESIENLSQLIEFDVRLAVIEANRSREQIQATATTRALQEETVRAELERLDVGASTTLLVSQAQRDLLEARIAEVEATINHRISLVNLYLAEGSLLERRGITLE